MKSSSLIAVLTVSTMLTSCSSGGGGGHHVPQTTLPNIPNTASAEITSMTNDGLSNSEKRLENFHSAQQHASSTMFRLRRAAPRVASQDDVDGAYQKMYDLLISDMIDQNTTNQELLMALLLAGFDMEELAGKDLRKFKDENDHRIKKDAHRMWKMYGKEKDVYLDNAGMTLVGSESAQNTKFNFVMNDKNDVEGITIYSEVIGADSITDKLGYEGNHRFAGKNDIKQYGFVKGGFRATVETTEANLGLDEIKSLLKAKIEQLATVEKDSYVIANKIQLIAHIESIPDLEFFGSDSDDKNVDHGFCIDVERDINAQYKSYAKDMKLKYSDFGTLSLAENRDDEDEIINETRVFAGGYEVVSVDPKTLSGEMQFEGKAVGGVNYSEIVAYEDDVKDSNTLNLNGDAVLNFKDGKETLNISFGNWYDIEAIKNVNSDENSIKFSGGEKIEDENFKFRDETGHLDNHSVNNFIDDKYNETTAEGSAGAMHIGYYGPNGKPSEATGFVMYNEEKLNGSVDVETGENLLDVLEMQIGVGMQKK